MKFYYSPSPVKWGKPYFMVYQFATRRSSPLGIVVYFDKKYIKLINRAKLDLDAKLAPEAESRKLIKYLFKYPID